MSPILLQFSSSKGETALRHFFFLLPRGKYVIRFVHKTCYIILEFRSFLFFDILYFLINEAILIDISIYILAQNCKLIPINLKHCVFCNFSSIWFKSMTGYRIMSQLHFYSFSLQ